MRATLFVVVAFLFASCAAAQTVYRLDGNDIGQEEFWTTQNLTNLTTKLSASLLTINPSRIGIPSMTGQSGKGLSTNGTTFQWTAFQPLSGELTTMATNGSAYYLNRANHTGFQLLATISDAGTLAALSSVSMAQMNSSAYSTGGNWTADSGKLVQFQGNGEITATNTLTVVATIGTWKPQGQLQPDLLTFYNVGGNVGRFYTLSLPPALSGSRFVYFPSASGTIARLEDITPAQLTQSGATTGQGIVWNGTSWAPGTVGGALTVGTTGITSGSGGRLMYETAGNKLGEVSGVTSDGTFLTFASKLVVSVAGAASTPALRATGAWYTAGTSTTSQPYFLIEPSGTSSTLWNPLGTGLAVHSASGFTGDALVLAHAGNPWFKFTLEPASGGCSFGPPGNAGFAMYGGAFYPNLDGNLGLGRAGVSHWSGLLLTSAGTVSWNDSTFLGSEATAVVQLGADVNGDAVDQTVKAADGITGTDRNGGDLNLSSGNSTGQGASAIVFKAPASSSSGTTARVAAERARIDGKGLRVGNIILWSDAANAPAEDPPTGCYYLYVDPATGALNTRSFNGNVQTITPP